MVTSFAIIEEAEKWTQGGDAGRYDGEFEFETGVIMLKDDPKGMAEILTCPI